MADSSFDVVSEVDSQEVANAINQAAKEVGQRYDFRGVDATVTLKNMTITMEANSPERTQAVLEVVRSKLVRRGVSLKALDLGDGEPKPSGKIYRLVGTIREGLTSEQAKKVTKIIRDQGPKGVKATVQGEAVRVSGKSRDALQEVIAVLKQADFEAPLQFTNYR